MNLPRVFVSGATGFLASHTIQQLLAAGHRVRASVRNPNRQADLAFLRELPGAGDRLELVEADLVARDPFGSLLHGCDVVLHMASPYQLDVTDPQRDLVDPAVEGTMAMLEACANTPGIRRVVITSSMAAVTDEPDDRKVLTEADWNERSSLTRNPYYFSKTLAERAAWAFMKATSRSWDLVVINPFLVMGPSMTKGLNTSNSLLANLLNGIFPGILSMTWGIVDVRDVADAHVRAMASSAANGRYLCAAGTISMRGIVDLLRAHGYSSFRLPSLSLDHPIGNQLAWMGSFLQPKGAGQYLRTHIGRVPRFDASKIQRDLDVRFRPIDQTILDTAADLVHWGHVPRNLR